MTSQVDIRESTIDDFLSIRSGHESDHELAWRIETSETPNIETALHQSAGTMTVDGAPLAIEGWAKRWGDVFYVWTIYSPDALRYPKALFQYTKRGLEAIERDFGAKRIEALISPGHEAAARWIERLGFEFEGRSVMADIDGGDLLLYARTGGHRKWLQ